MRNKLGFVYSLYNLNNNILLIWAHIEHTAFTINRSLIITVNKMFLFRPLRIGDSKQIAVPKFNPINFIVLIFVTKLLFIASSAQVIITQAFQTRAVEYEFVRCSFYRCRILIISFHFGWGAVLKFQNLLWKLLNGETVTISASTIMQLLEIASNTKMHFTLYIFLNKYFTAVFGAVPMWDYSTTNYPFCQQSLIDIREDPLHSNFTCIFVRVFFSLFTVKCWYEN